MAGFWQAVNDDRKNKNIDGGTVGDNVNAFLSNAGHSLLSGVVKSGAEVANGFGSFWNQKETDKRTNDFMKSSGLDKAPDIQYGSSSGAANAGAITGSVASIPANIVEGIINSAGAVGNTLGTVASTPIANDTANKIQQEQQSIQKQRQELLDNAESGPRSPDSNPVDNMSKSDKKMFDALGKKADDLSKQAKDSSDARTASLDPTKFASNAVNTALNAVGVGALGNIAKAEKAAAGVADTTQGLKIASNLDRATAAMNDSRVGQAASRVAGAFVNPTSVKEGAMAYGAGGALQGGLQSAANGDNTQEIVAGGIMGGLEGAAGGSVGGFFGGRNAGKVTTPALQPIGTAQEDAAFTAGTSKLAQEMTPAPTQVVNGTGEGSSKVPDLDPFHPSDGASAQTGATGSEATNTPIPGQDVTPGQSLPVDNPQNPNMAALTNQQMSLSDLAASATRPAFTDPKASFIANESKSFAPLDSATTAKMNTLSKSSDALPLQDGYTRLYQTNEGKLKSDQFFQDKDLLANYINGRADNANLSFRDVPNDAVKTVPGKPDVFKVDENKVDDLQSKYADKFSDNPDNSNTMSVKELASMANSRDSALSSDEREKLLGAVDNAYKQGLKDSDHVNVTDAKAGKVTYANADVTPGTTIKADIIREGGAPSGGAQVTQKPRQVDDSGYAAARDAVTQSKSTVADNAPLETHLSQGISDTAQNANLPADVKNAVEAIGDSTGELGADYKSAETKGQKIAGALTNNLDNVTNNTSRMAGKVGADFADKMQSGFTTKSSFIDDTAHNVENIEKYAKDEKMTIQQQKDSTARVTDAIANDDTSKLTPQDKVLYDNISSLWGKAKDLREQQGRAVKDNYVTHVNIDNESNKAGRVADAIFGNKDPEMLSMFSKKQGEHSAPIDNLYTIARKYQQGMANDLGYHDAQKFLADNLEKIPASLANDPKNMAEFKSYVSDLMDHAINGSSETAASRVVAKYMVNPFTDNILRFNIGNSLKNFTDQIRSGSLVSKEAKGIKPSDDIVKDFTENNMNFRYGGTNRRSDPTLENSRASNIGRAIDKISPNIITEKKQLQGNAVKGLQQGFHMSDVYQSAKAKGMSDADAQALAWKEDKEGVMRTANYIAGTSNAGNAMQQIASLRNGKPLLGIVPWSAVTRFASYPLTNTMNLVRNMKPAEARAIEAYGRGDIMGSKMADIRGNAKTLLDMYQNAAKQGDTSIPKEVLDTKVQTIKNAIKAIDDELAKGSRISKGNTAMTYAKIWGATTAIQMAVVGSQDAIFNRTGSNAKQKSVLGTVITQTPFLDINRVLNPIINGSPIQSNGQGQPSVNARGIVNAVPYAGGIDNLTGNNLSNWLNTNVVKGANKDIAGAYQ